MWNGSKGGCSIPLAKVCIPYFIVLYICTQLLYSNTSLEPLLENQMIPIPLWTFLCPLQRMFFLAWAISFLSIYFFYYGNHINNAVSADLLVMQYVAASVICLLSSVWYWRIWNITFTTGKQVGYICLHMQIMRGFLLVCMHIFLLDFFFLQIRCKILLFVSFYKLYK